MNRIMNRCSFIFFSGSFLSIALISFASSSVTYLRMYFGLTNPTIWYTNTSAVSAKMRIPSTTWITGYMISYPDLNSITLKIYLIMMKAKHTNDLVMNALKYCLLSPLLFCLKMPTITMRKNYRTHTAPISRTKKSENVIANLFTVVSVLSIRLYM